MNLQGEKTWPDKSATFGLIQAQLSSLVAKDHLDKHLKTAAWISFINVTLLIDFMYFIFYSMQCIFGLDDCMRAFEKIRGLVFLDCYFSGRMETIST